MIGEIVDSLKHIYVALKNLVAARAKLKKMDAENEKLRGEIKELEEVSSQQSQRIGELESAIAQKLEPTISRQAQRIGELESELFRPAPCPVCGERQRVRIPFMRLKNTHRKNGPPKGSLFDRTKETEKECSACKGIFHAEFG